MTTSLDESARLAGNHQWAEARLFEVLGGWVKSTSEPEVRLLLDRHSQHCAWRSGQWFDRLPVLADVEREALCGASSPPVAEAMAQLGRFETVTARMAAAYRFALPRLWTAYDAHRRRLGSRPFTADSSTVRTLDIAQADLAADWHEGEALLEELLGDEASVSSAAEAVARLESVLAVG